MNPVPDLAPFLVFLSVLLLSRLVLIQRESPVDRRQALGLATVQSGGLLAATPTPALVVLVAVITGANLIGAWLERRQPLRLAGVRLGILFVILLAAGFVFAPAQGVTLNPLLLAAGDWLGRHWLYLSSAGATSSSGFTGTEAALVLAGALLVVNEANLLIRGILQLIRVVPHAGGGGATTGSPATVGEAVLILPARRPGEAPQHLDLREYNAGRYIGVLERVLVYTFVLQGQYSAIALVVAAKGFARFKDMDQRDFAEYVVIGTLLSVASAVLIAEGVKLLLA